MKDLKQIINESISGNIKAQEMLYSLFAPKMFAVCLRYSKNKTEAEDNLQEGFIRVFSNIKKFRHEGSLEGWIKRIMTNVSLEKYRERLSLYPVEDLSYYENQYVSEDILANIAAQDLLALIQELSPRYQIVFNLYVMEGLSHEEIARELNISVGTSKSNLARARGVLQEKIKKLYGK